MQDLLTRLYRTKTLLSSVVLVMAGVLLMVIGKRLDGDATSWIALLPWSELGGILIGAGLLSVWLDHFLNREQAAIEELRLRTILHEQAPAMRDAVLEAFAANHEDLARVATPHMLDHVITNSLALRLDDQQFASEIYTDIREQAVGASERWHDAHLSIELSPLPMGSGVAKSNTTEADTSGFFTVTVRWEYTAIPKHPQRRFVCLSDRDEYAELAGQRGATSAWFLKPVDGVDASKPDSFQLLRFAVNGEERAIRRSAKKTGQTYTANVGQGLIDAAEPVTISYTYQTITRQHGHLLFFDIEQPTRDLKVDFYYTDCGIDTVSTLDLIPSVRPTRIEHSPDSVPNPTAPSESTSTAGSSHDQAWRSSGRWTVKYLRQRHAHSETQVWHRWGSLQPLGVGRMRAKG